MKATLGHIEPEQSREPIEKAAAALETFQEDIDIESVVFQCDELSIYCPITGQPDFYTLEIGYTPVDGIFLETKSLKQYLQSFRNADIFCEEIAAVIAVHLGKAVGADLTVVLTQKARGGITTTATARHKTTPV